MAVNIHISFIKGYSSSCFGILDPTELLTINWTLKYVALSRGTQNYTCASSGSFLVQISAIATLFDVTRLAYFDESVLNALPPLVIYIPLWPSGLDLPPPFGNILVLGHHFFDSAGTLVFDLHFVNKILYGKKKSDTKAPVTANKGPARTSAVDWLQLTANLGYNSVGLSLAYRVMTTGGEPSICTINGVMTIQYAVEYWFYN
jgi:hypothetical protein